MKQTTKTKTKYRVLQWTLFGSEFISILTPFVVIGAVKFDEFFVNNPEGWKITLGGTICLAVCGLCVLLTTRAKEKELQMNPLVSLMIVFGIISLLSFLFANILFLLVIFKTFASQFLKSIYVLISKLFLGKNGNLKIRQLCTNSTLLFTFIKLLNLVNLL